MANKKIRFTSPKGRAKYPWLNRPDTQFSAEGVYTTHLIMDPKEAAELVALIKKTAEDEFGPTAKYSAPYEIDEETGEVIIKTKSNYVPPFDDSTGQVIMPEAVPQLFAGSILCVGGFVKAYTVSGRKGVSLQLGRVQIIDPVSSGAGGASPFAAVEGGYVASSAKPEVTEDTDDDFNF